MPDCESCGSFVSADFARVFGNNDDTVQACLECTSMTEIIDGGAVVSDRSAEK